MHRGSLSPDNGMRIDKSLKQNADLTSQIIGQKERSPSPLMHADEYKRDLLQQIEEKSA